MMKKALAYAMTAILLGIATMLAPLMLVETLNEENTFGEDSLGRAVCPSNLSSVGLMLIPSFLIALGAFLYLKKRMF